MERLPWHHEQQALQIVGRDLVKHNLDVQRRLEPEREVPHRAAEDQVEYLRVTQVAAPVSDRDDRWQYRPVIGATSI